MFAPSSTTSTQLQGGLTTSAKQVLRKTPATNGAVSTRHHKVAPQQARKTVFSTVGPTAAYTGQTLTSTTGASKKHTRAPTSLIQHQVLNSATANGNGNAFEVSANSARSNGGGFSTSLLSATHDNLNPINLNFSTKSGSGPQASGHSHKQDSSLLTLGTGPLLSQRHKSQNSGHLLSARNQNNTGTTLTATLSNAVVGGVGGLSEAAPNASWVTQETLLRTVEALVEHFESKIDSLAGAGKQSAKATSARQEASQDILQRVMQIVAGETEPQSKQAKASPRILHNSDKENTKALLPKADAKAPPAQTKKEVGDSQKTQEVAPETAQKSNKALLQQQEQLTIGQVPSHEISSAISSAKNGGGQQNSTRQKSSRSRKKLDKSNHHLKAPATEPFKTNTGVTNGAKTATAATNKKKASVQHQPRKNSSLGHSSSRSMTQNLFKPNPNFTKTQQASVKSSINQHPGQKAAKHSRQVSSDAAVGISNKDLSSARSRDESSLALAKEASVSRLHFQDIYSGSGLLKSIGSKEESLFDCDQKNPLSSGVQAAKMTPGLGVPCQDSLLDLARQGSVEHQAPFEGVSLKPAEDKLGKTQEIVGLGVGADQCQGKVEFDHSREISKSEDVTPEKGKDKDNILELLSSLEGLTPAGLEHLMATQDKLATSVSNTTTQARTEVIDNEPATDRRISDTIEPHFGSANRTSYTQGRRENTTELNRAHGLSQKGSCTARQTLHFVDASDQASIPSPSPSISQKKSMATLEPQRSSRISTDLYKKGGDNPSKRLIYDSLSSQSNRQAVTPRVSSSSQASNLNSTQQLPEKAIQSQNQSQKTSAASSRRQKSTKIGSSSGYHVRPYNAQKGTSKDPLTTSVIAQKQGAQSSVLDSRRLNSSRPSTNPGFSSTAALGHQSKPHRSTGQRSSVTPRVLGQTRNTAPAQTSRPERQEEKKSNAFLTRKQSADLLGHQAIKASFQTAQCEGTSSNASFVTAVAAQTGASLVSGFAKQNKPASGVGLAAMKISENQDAIGGQSSLVRNPLMDQFMTAAATASQQRLESSTTVRQQAQKTLQQSNNSASCRSLGRTNNSQSRYEERFKQLSQLMEKHTTESVESMERLQMMTHSWVGLPVNPPNAQSKAQNRRKVNAQQTLPPPSEHLLQKHLTATAAMHQAAVQADRKSTESTVVQKETHYNIGIESERPSSDELLYGEEPGMGVDDEPYRGEGVDEDIEAQINRCSQASQDHETKSPTSEKVALRKRQMLDEHQGVDENDGPDPKFKQTRALQESQTSMGSLEKQIQQIVLSRDLLQNMDIDLGAIKMKDAGSMLEPKEGAEASRCQMLRPQAAADEDPDRSSMRANTAQEMEPSSMPVLMTQLNLSGDEAADIEGDLMGSHLQGISDGPGTAEFEQNASNVSFG